MPVLMAAFHFNIEVENDAATFSMCNSEDSADVRQVVFTPTLEKFFDRWKIVRTVQ